MDKLSTDRRSFLRFGLAGAGALAVGPGILAACQPSTGGGGGPTTTAPVSNLPFGPLSAANADGLELPAGFTSRVVAVSGQLVSGTAYTWHVNPDGGACFVRPGGGWTYVSNSEINPGGGVSALDFNAAGTIVAARSILSGTQQNCAGGATPWGSWLSGEEVSRGKIWEGDPTGTVPGVARDALGWFTHEAAAVDPTTGRIYLTEDRTDGALYRFTPTTAGNLSAGLLEVLTESGGLGWAAVPIPNPSTAQTSTRLQVATTKHFNGGEGIWYHAGTIAFTTKGDNRVWSYDIAANTLTVIYDAATHPTPILTGVDNVCGSASGNLYVAEDGGNLEIVILKADGTAGVVARRAGDVGSELTGVAFSPDGSRLYFSSQRSPGTTLEVTGPFI